MMMQDLAKANLDLEVPFLEHYPEPGGVAHRILLDRLPFQIGRSMTAQFIIYSRQVSKEHAQIFRDGEDYHIRDLGSMNGTFVNGRRILEAKLINGDIIHVGQKEFRFGCERPGTEPTTDGPSTESADSKLPVSLIHSMELLLDLIKHQRVRTVFQTIVHLDTRAIMGYEALGRGTDERLSSEPADLFHLAERFGMAAELSHLFRQTALCDAALLPPHAPVFLNIHPAELDNRTLVSGLGENARTLGGRRRIIIEAHENVMLDLPTMSRLRDQLAGEGIGLAYDDFGAGQARLTHLTDVPPDFLKLDMKLIRGLDSAKARQEIVQALSVVGQDLGVQLIAEGIETEEEAAVCLRLGCSFGQGFLFSRPEPVAVLVGEEAGLSS